jgi:hypothetical protein
MVVMHRNGPLEDGLDLTAEQLLFVSKCPVVLR